MDPPGEITRVRHPAAADDAADAVGEPTVNFEV